MHLSAWAIRFRHNYSLNLALAFPKKGCGGSHQNENESPEDPTENGSEIITFSGADLSGRGVVR